MIQFIIYIYDTIISKKNNYLCFDLIHIQASIQDDNYELIVEKIDTSNF